MDKENFWSCPSRTYNTGKLFDVFDKEYYALMKNDKLLS